MVQDKAQNSVSIHIGQYLLLRLTLAVNENENETERTVRFGIFFSNIGPSGKTKTKTKQSRK